MDEYNIELNLVREKERFLIREIFGLKEKDLTYGKKGKEDVDGEIWERNEGWKE